LGFFFFVKTSNMWVSLLEHVGANHKRTKSMGMCNDPRGKVINGRLYK